MTDPVFQSRAELEAWRQSQVEDFMKDAPYATNQARLMLARAETIRRVTAAHDQKED